MTATFTVDTYDRVVRVYRDSRFWRRPRYRSHGRTAAAWYPEACRNRARRCRAARKLAVLVGELSGVERAPT